MILENLENINQKILKTLELYELNNKMLNEIILNNYKYSNEEIELMKEMIFQTNKNVQYLKKTILNIKKNYKLENISITEKILKLDLEINKFWYKFYIKLKKEDKKSINYWRNEYLECYKKIFFQNKDLNIKQINNLIQNELLKNENSISLQL
ncbi:hypothetical protein [Spiroplasma endosymbiont of Aleiodes alternator]|uniref:hypothetical protein n=1 Tax=Spiroplasma endosymbiont of Aleiodes alternator TaxID=3139329 RepID=UPI003CCAB508